MFINHHVNELICHVCGRTKRYRELIFDKNQLLGYGDAKGKQSKYNPMRNFNKWIQKITCCDEQVPKEVLEKIKNKFRRDYIDYDDAVNHEIGVRQIRKCLKILNLTAYNTYTAAIKQYITGQEPPHLT
jgi:intergrase/recombinase